MAIPVKEQKLMKKAKTTMTFRITRGCVNIKRGKCDDAGKYDDIINSENEG
jgi:hypothetical protein